MALSLRPSLLPQCTACTRRLTSSLYTPISHQPTTQIRTKKTLTKSADVIFVRLRKDMPTFGRRGAVVPVANGRMRNEFFPQRQADYVTPAGLKELKAKNVSMERDFEFGAAEDATAGAPVVGPAGKKKKAQSQVERITPERSVQLLEILIPARLDFVRKAIESAPAAGPTPAQLAEQAARQKAERRRGDDAMSDLMAAREEKPKVAETSTGPVAIFGSVSTADVVLAMRGQISSNEEASKIALAEEDVRFVDVRDESGQIGDAERVKHLGEFIVEVSIRGIDTTVRRSVRVLPRDRS